MVTRTRPQSKAAKALSKPDLLAVYRTMLLSRRMDDREIQLKRQNKIFFQISGAGHEAVLAAAGKVLRPAYDWFYPYYRDRALCLALGVTPNEMLLAGGRRRPTTQARAAGRCRPTGAAKPSTSSISSSPTGTQFLQAVGCAEAALALSAASARSRDPRSQRRTGLRARAATAQPARASSGRR